MDFAKLLNSGMYSSVTHFHCSIKSQTKFNLAEIIKAEEGGWVILSMKIIESLPECNSMVNPIM